jgi:hypothetical protein
MVWARRLWLRLRSLFLRRRITQRLDDEVQFHLDRQIAENIAAGMSRQEARYAARRTFGNVTWVKEEVRAMWGWTLWETIFRELRYAARTSGIYCDCVSNFGARHRCEHGDLHSRGFGPSETARLSRERPPSRLLGTDPTSKR